MDGNIFSFGCSVQLLSHVLFVVTSWTAAHQASLSITRHRVLMKSGLGNRGDRDNTPITGHHQAGREKTAEALIAVSSNGQAAGCPAESRTGRGGGEGRETEPWHV